MDGNRNINRGPLMRPEPLEPAPPPRHPEMADLMRDQVGQRFGRRPTNLVGVHDDHRPAAGPPGLVAGPGRAQPDLRDAHPHKLGRLGGQALTQNQPFLA